MRGRDDAHVDADGLLGAERLHLALLDGAQDLGLGGGAQVADLVEKQGAQVGEGELAPPGLGGAGEGALFVAEELALDERLGDGGAVHGDEGL